MDLLTEFRNYLFSQDKKASKATVKNYLSDINHFIRWWETNFNQTFNPQLITHGTIEAYKKDVSSISHDVSSKDKNEQYKIPNTKYQILSSSSIERHLSTLRKFFKFLKLESKISVSPFETENLKLKIEDDPWHIKDFKSFLYVYNASHLTIKNYLIDIKQFLNWAAEVKSDGDISGADTLKHINPKLIDEYKARLVAQGAFSSSTINRKLSSLRKYVLWAVNENLINPFESEIENIQEIKETPVFIPEKEFSFPSTDKLIQPHYSKFPPFRLMQKLTKGVILAVDATLISQIAKLIEKSQYVLWTTKGKPIFDKAKKIKLVRYARKEDIFGVKNISKEFYAPLEMSTKNFPWYKKAWFSARYKRPKWYKTYHSYAIAHYLNFAVLVIFVVALSLGFYNGFVKNQSPTLAANPNLPTGPNRILSFQGRLTDNNDNPITAATNLRFSIYRDGTATGAGILLWQEVDQVSPDQDGIFNSLLGNTTSVCSNPNSPATGPCAIPSTLFSENNALYIGATVENTPELTPRQPIATVAFAANSETLQGLLPITATAAGTTNVVLALDSTGNLTIGGSANPTFQASGGQFKLSGNSLVLTTNAASNGNIQLAPDGLGVIDLTKPLVNTSISNNISTARGSVEVDDLFSILATSSGQSALTINQTGAGPLISASASGAQRFTISNAGAIGLTGGFGVSGQCLTTAGSATAASWGTCGGVNWWNQLAGALSPVDITNDFLLGSTATSTAEFAFTGLGLSNHQTQASFSGRFVLMPNNGYGGDASLSGQLILGALSNPTIQTTNKQTLTIGGNTTGNININSATTGNSSGGLISVSQGASNVGGAVTISGGSDTVGGVGGSITINAGNGISQDGNINIGTAGPDGSNGILNIGTGGAQNQINLGLSTVGLSVNSLATFNNGATFSTTGVTFSGVTTDITTGSNENLSIVPSGTGKISLFNTTPLASFDVRNNTVNGGTLAVASVSGKTSFAALVANNDGVGDIFTASASGWTRFTINGVGAIGLTSGFGIANQCLTSQGAGSPSTWGTCGGSGSGNSPFAELAGAIVPNNSTEDLLIGGQATTSAIFAFINVNSGTPTIKIWDSVSHNNALSLSATATGASIVASTGIIDIGQGGGTLYVQTDIQNDSTTNLGAIQITDRLNVLPASTSNINSNAALIVNNPGTGDIFTASGGGTTRFTVNNAGALGLTAGYGLSGQCLTTAGSATAASWGTCGGVNWWNQLAGALSPVDITNDFLLGSTATSTAKFSYTGIKTGNTIASISGQLLVYPNNGYGGNASLSAGLVIGANSLPIIQTTKNQLLAIGGNTTGNITLLPNNGTGGVINLNAPTIDSNASTLTAFGTPTTLTLANSVTTLGLGATTGTLTLNNPTIATSVTSGTLALFNAGLTGTLNIAGAITGNINLAGGSASTGCSIDGSTGNLTCSGSILTTATTGIQGWWNVLNGSLFPTNSTLDVLLGGQSSASAGLRVTGASAFKGTLSVASVSGKTSFAALVANNDGVGDLFAASASGVNRFVIKENGRVGIGTANPGYTLDIQGDWRSTIGTSYYQFGGTEADAEFNGGPDGIFAFTNTGVSTGGTWFRYSGSYKLAIMNSGRIGVGTTAPISTLDIRGADGAGTLAVASASGKTSFATLVANNDGVGDLFTASQSGWTRFVIKGNGNVGINNSNPQAALDIGGASSTISNTSGDITITPTGNLVLATGGHGFSVGGGVGTNTQCLLGSTSPAWGSCSGTSTGVNWWNQLAGALSPINTTNDLLIGSTATSSALFSYTGIKTGQTIASISGQLIVMPNNGWGGQVGIGTTNPGKDELVVQRDQNGWTSILSYNATNGTNAGGEFLAQSATSLGYVSAYSSNYAVSNLSDRFSVGAATDALGLDLLAEATAGDIRFYTGGTATTNERMRIDSSGNVGIGTTSSLATLDVRGNSGTISVASVSGKTSFAILIANNNGVGDLFTASASSQTRFVIANNGNVGIGTASATRLLNLSSSGSTINAPQLLIENAGSGDSALELKNGNNIFYAGLDNSAGTFAINSYSAATSGTTVNFGQDWSSISPSTNDSNTDTIQATKFTAGVTGPLTNISVSFATKIDTNSVYSVAIYDDNAGAAGDLLGQHTGTSAIEIVTPGGINWNTQNLDSPVNIVSGQVYWLAFYTNDVSSFKSTGAGGGVSNYEHTITSPGNWTSTFTGNGSGSFNTSTWENGIYGAVNTATFSNAFANSLFTIGQTGATTFRNTVNSTNAFTVKDALGNNVFNVNTQRSSVAIGVGATESANIRFQVTNSDNSTAAAQVWNAHPNRGGTTACTSTLCHTGLAIKLGDNKQGAQSPGLSDRFINFQLGNSQIIGKVQGNNAGGVAYATTGGDYAEWFMKANLNDTFEYGELVCVGPNGKAIKCDNNNGKILGVVSSNFGFLGNASHDGDPNWIIVGLVGQVDTKVNSEGGDIKAGDLLTYSSIPGVAKKAIKAGFVIGRAMENGNSGKINVYVNPTWYDPDVQLTSTGNLNIIDGTPNVPLTIEHEYTLSTPFGINVDKIGAFAEIAVSKLRAGFIDSQQISTKALLVASENITINGQSLRDYISSIVSGLINGNNTANIAQSEFKTDLISSKDSSSKIALKFEKDKLSILRGTDASSSAVSSFDNLGNATFSGELTSDNLRITSDASIAGTLRTGRIIADNIEGLDKMVNGQLSMVNGATTSATYITNVTNVYSNPFPTIPATQSTGSGVGVFDSLLANNNFINIATFSSQLAYVENLSAQIANFGQGLNVFGPTSLSDTSITGQLSLNGSLILANNSIDTLGSDLNLQGLRQGGLSIMAGLVYIDTDGNIKIGGNATVNGTLYANAISSLPGTDLTLKFASDSSNVIQSSEFRIQNSENSNIFNLNQQGNLIASGEATFSKLNLGLVSPAFAVSPTEIMATGSAGTAVLNPNTNQLTIDNKLVTDKSLIYITPKSTTNNQVLFLLRQVPNKSFTVGVENTLTSPIQFNWIIVN